MVRRANRLQEIRTARGMTQKDVADKLQLSLATVNRHERGNRRLSPAAVRMYADLYNVEGVDLFINR